jgi:ribonucleases P/MRP protein subunit RPP40
MTDLATGDRCVLQTTEEEKDLGVWFDSNLKFSSHVAHAVSKGNQTLGLIKRSFTYLDENLVKQLYISLVRPHLEYGNVVWHRYLRKDVNLLEAVQHRATKLVPDIASLPYEDRLKKLDLPSLTYRRLRGDAIEIYKYLHDVYDVDSSELLPLAQSGVTITRGHALKLVKRRCKLQLRSNMLGYRMVNFWNSLPEDVVCSETVDVFKGRFDRVCRHLRYRTDDVYNWCVKDDRK